MRMVILKASTPKFEAKIAPAMDPAEAACFRFHEIIDGIVFGAEEGLISHREASTKLKELLSQILEQIAN